MRLWTLEEAQRLPHCHQQPLRASPTALAALAHACVIDQATNLPPLVLLSSTAYVKKCMEH